MIILPKVGYSKEIINVAKIIAKQNKSICYVSANKPEKTIVKLFNENGIDREKFLIIDCVSESVARQAKDRTTIFIRSPSDLTELSLAIAEALNHGVENVFVDALSTFVIYEKELVIVKFAHNIISRIRVSERRGVFIVLKGDISNILLEELSMFVDSIVEMS